MACAIVHRGPDDEGVWLDREAGIALGHRRLSILDLSAAGHQPMHSSSGRYVIVFNGEVYNHAAIRRELEQIEPRIWRGHSDTEVMLEAFEAWGIEGALQRFCGMFAIALWDRRERKLHLMRDRIGEKPLYYGWCGKTFLFGSELKAIRAHPEFSADIDRNALALYMRHNCIPAPHTIYQSIYKLIPGSVLTVSASDTVRPQPEVYWSALSIAEQGLKTPFQGSDREAAESLEQLLRDAIGSQMIADVPLGAFLSGGIDSSTIVALMQAQSNRPVKTFTIGFSESDYNEAPFAREVARHLGTDHAELYVTPEDCLSVIPCLPTMYDEPFADSSQIPTYLVSQLTRQHVAVGLSGDAGDELFGGYNRYFWWRKIWERVHNVPLPLRRSAAMMMKAVSPSSLTAVFNAMSPLLPRSMRQKSAGDKLHKLAGILDVHDPMEMYGRFVSHWHNPTNLVVGSTEPITSVSDRSNRLSVDDNALQMMYLDLISYLPDDILVKVDRAAMAVSLETRVPFLDHRVVEFAWRLPSAMKIRNGQGKWILRQILYKYVPEALIERPKAGFGIPIVTWLRGPLRDWAEALLDERRLREEGFFSPEPIRIMWKQHLSGSHNWQYHLWDVLMFQAWLENTRGTSC